MSINEVQDEVIAEFNDFDDWMDRYQLLIDLKPCMAAGGRGKRPNRFPSRKRCFNCKRHYLAAYQSAVRTYPGRDSECGPLLYRQDRIKGASFSHTQ